VPAPLEVLADEAIVRQALSQVLANAFKFTAKVAEPVISVSVHQAPEGKVQLWVEDNGAGFNPAMHDKLFKVFGRLHSAKQFPGLGVGLLTAQRLLAKVGATISLVPREQGGTLACLSFPQAKK